MSLFKHIKARIGSGAMTVGLRYEKDSYRRGEEVKGVIEIVGGEVEEKALGILIYLMIEKTDGRTISYGDYKVHTSFDIQAGEKKSFPFIIELPVDGPYTTETESLFLMTNVVKFLAFDQRDKKYISVLP